MNIFFDLDGTLVDASDRLFRLFQFLVPNSELTKDSYWKLKKNKISHAEILRNQFKYSDQQIKEFENTWLHMIELPEWIALDKPVENSTLFLWEQKKIHSLFVVTARQSEEQALMQIQRYGWESIFEDVLVTKHQQEKSEMILTKEINIGSDWIVGDTGKDIETGKRVGLLTAAVLSGFLNQEKLLEYKPDIIVNSVVDLVFDE